MLLYGVVLTVGEIAFNAVATVIGVIVPKVGLALFAALIVFSWLPIGPLRRRSAQP